MKLLDQVREVPRNRHDGTVGLAAKCRWRWGRMPTSALGPPERIARYRNKGVVLFPEIG